MHASEKKEKEIILFTRRPWVKIMLETGGQSGSDEKHGLELKIHNLMQFRNLCAMCYVLLIYFCTSDLKRGYTGQPEKIKPKKSNRQKY